MMGRVACPLRVVASGGSTARSRQADLCLFYMGFCERSPYPLRSVTVDICMSLPKGVEAASSRSGCRDGHLDTMPRYRVSPSQRSRG